MEILCGILLMIGGFLLGGVMFSQWIPRVLQKKDIGKISVDNNPGAFNAIKHCGKKVGMLCLVLDVLKGFLPVLLASLFLRTDSLFFPFVLVAPVLGHALGVFNRFHGGKCIATSFGCMAGLLPVAWTPLTMLAALYLLSFAIKTGNAKRSVAVYALFLPLSCIVLGVQGLPLVGIGCGCIAVFPIVKFLFTKNGLVDNRLHDPSPTPASAETTLSETSTINAKSNAVNEVNPVNPVNATTAASSMSMKNVMNSRMNIAANRMENNLPIVPMNTEKDGMKNKRATVSRNPAANSSTTNVINSMKNTRTNVRMKTEKEDRISEAPILPFNQTEPPFPEVPDEELDQARA